MTVKQNEILCLYCGLGLSGQPHHFEPTGVSYHDNCREIYDGYLYTRNAHTAWCHLENCDKAPRDPFKVSR